MTKKLWTKKEIYEMLSYCYEYINKPPSEGGGVLRCEACKGKVYRHSACAMTRIIPIGVENIKPAKIEATVERVYNAQCDPIGMLIFEVQEAEDVQQKTD